MSKLNKTNSKDKKVLVQARLPFKIISERDHSTKETLLENESPKISKIEKNDSKFLHTVDTKENFKNLELKSNESFISTNKDELPSKNEIVAISDDEEFAKGRDEDQAERSSSESPRGTENDSGKITEKIHIKLPLDSNKKKRKLSKSFEAKTINTNESQNNSETISKKIKISPTGEHIEVEKFKTRKIKKDTVDEDEVKINDLEKETSSVDLPSLTEDSINCSQKEDTLHKSPETSNLDIGENSSIKKKLNYEDEVEKFEEEKQDDTESDVEMKSMETVILVIEENSNNEESDSAEGQTLLENNDSPPRNNSKRTEDEAELSTPQTSSGKKKVRTRKSLTPANQLKKEELEKKREEKKKQKEELERKREEEKAKQKEEQEKKKEEKRKQKEEREKLSRQKMEERKKREEQKEEERRRKDEEKRKKEQEREEIENKKRKEAENFTKFFVPKKLLTESIDSLPEQSTVERFMPFRIKDGMKLAPPQRRKLNKDSKKVLDEIITKNDKEISMNDLYLAKLKSGAITPGRCLKTLLSEDSKDDITIIEDELEDVGQAIDDSLGNPLETFRAKFLLFNENRRPPYYGTWRKKSSCIKPKQPFAKDNDHFNYEVDSDEEWEEEEPGESLLDSDEDKESEDEYEVDNEFFVPHGHLSDEELKNDEDADDIDDSDAQEKKLKLRQQEFDEEINKKTEKIKPRLIGAVWQDENGNQPESCPNVIWKCLSKRAMILKNEMVILEKVESEKMETGSPERQQQQLKKKSLRKTHLNDCLIMDLIRLVHGNRHKKEFMIKEFQMYLGKQLNSDTISSEYSKALIRENIENIAKWGCIEIKVKDKKKKKLCWIVKPEMIEKYRIKDITLSNKWEYILKPKNNIIESEEINHESPAKINIINMNETEKLTSCPETEQLAKTATNEQKNIFIRDKKSSCSGDLNSKSPTVKLNKSKKRVSLLASGPLGQELPSGKQNTLISNFLKSNCKSDVEKNKSTSTTINQNIKNSDDDEVILIE